ncbi:2'-5' RNA ligase family protein [Kitasatospora sp. NPDC001175]|uniref:2'-5' RNA ligase family protein n=1 Tax=Kitasatospora sp. NPDC001175 TaxID=3157103 RepID=UPI003D094620
MTDTPERMADHWWWRPGWSVGRRFYTWHLTFADAPDVHQLAADYRHALADVAGLDLIPDPWLHLTMQGIGFVGEVSESEARAIAAAAAVHLAKVPAFDLALGPAIVTPEALLLKASPSAKVDAVRTAIRAGIGDLWSKVPEAADGFRPHVSVAYSNANGPAAPAAAALETVTSYPATFRVATAELIVLHRDRRMYEWEPLVSVPLG